MKRIITIAGSNSQKSINKSLIIYTSGLLENVEVISIDLNDRFAQEIAVFDITGKMLLREQAVNSNSVSIPFSAKAKGLYFVSVVDNQGNKSTAKFAVSQ